MNITLNLDRAIFNDKLYPLLFDYSHRFEGYKGSAGSGKSYFISQKLIIRACREKIRILVCRRYGTTIRNTVFALFKQLLTDWQLLPYVKIRESDYNISFPNGSEIIFCGLDDETKLLSLTNIGCIFVEEVFEVSENTFEQLNLRMRGRVKNQQLIFAFNPINKKHWLYKFCVEAPPQSFIFSETTFRDNKFLSAEYVAALEELYTRNPQKARVYCDGEWGIDPEGLVFQNWKVEAFDPLSIASGLECRAGCDEGWADPSVVVASLWDEKNKIIYVYDEFYKSGCQLDQIAQAVERMRLTRTRIYCDSAAPRLIDFLKRQGYPAYPCIKGADSVEARILFLQNHKIIIHPNCEHLIDNFENFAYERDKNGEFNGKTTHEFSHGIDALGYAYSDIYTKNKMKTLDKRILGL